MGASRSESSAREDCSIVPTSRTKTSSIRSNFFFGILIRADQEQVGEVPPHDRASFVDAVRDGAVELLDEFEGSAHWPWETVLVGHGLAVRNWLTSIQSVCELDLAICKGRRR
jgi:hypothetical protein